MATKQVDGSATTATSTVNNGGAAKMPGAVDSDSVITKAVNFGQVGLANKYITVTDTSTVDKAVSSAVLPYQVEGKYVIRKVSTTLAGVTKTNLKSGASRQGELVGVVGINKTGPVRVTHYATAIREGKWNPVSGVWDAGYPAVGASSMYDNAGTLATNATDKEANSSAALPGNFNYIGGPLDPISAAYNARYGSTTS